MGKHVPCCRGQLRTPNQNEYVWYRSFIPGSVKVWYGSGSAIRTLIRIRNTALLGTVPTVWSGLRIRIRIHINLSCWLRIRIRIQIADPDPDPGGQKLPTKIEKSTEFSCFEVLDVLFGGLKVSSVAWASFMEA